MNPTFTRTLAGALAAATFLSVLPAQAGERWRHPPRPIVVERQSSGDEWLAAGILGLAAGVVIAGVASQPAPAEPIYRRPRPSPDRDYFPPAPVYYDEEEEWVDAGYEPWTRGWYRYCSDRYRSFDPGTGTYMGYDGVRRFCVAN